MNKKTVIPLSAGIQFVRQNETRASGPQKSKRSGQDTRAPIKTIPLDGNKKSAAFRTTDFSSLP
ncbi:MAG: hypothetical protein LBI87_02470 [Candidatus Accumulibacter sp.]|jgi:hypothetical protein|nr:hypothetical protein [Accumulibacter sp.]